MILVKLRLLPISNSYKDDLDNTKTTKAHVQSSVSTVTMTSTEGASRTRDCNIACKKGKHDDALPTFVINGIKYREEPYLPTNEGMDHTDALMLTEEDITQMRKELQAGGRNSRADIRLSAPPLNYHTCPAEGLREPSISLQPTAHLEVRNRESEYRENSVETLVKGREDDNDKDVEEVLVPLELCVATPFVSEIWDNWPEPARNGAPSAELFSPMLPLEKAIKVCSNAFLCVYTAGYAGCLSLEAETVVCAAVMRLLRCQLLSLLQGVSISGNDDIRYRALKEVLQRYCVVSGNACQVLWHPSMVQEMAKTLEANSMLLQAHHQCNAEGELATRKAEEGNEEIPPASACSDVHEIVVPQTEEGMELWSDDGENRKDDWCIEERIIRASRRKVANNAASRNVTSTFSMPPLAWRSGDSFAAFTSLIVRDINLSQTCLSLRWSWRDRLSKLTKEKYIALHVIIDSLTTVRQSRRDEHVMERLISRLYNNFLLTAERHRENGNSSLSDLNTMTASVNDYQIVLQSYEQCILLAQRGVLLPYKTHWLSQEFNPTTNPGSISGKYAAVNESRRRIYSVLANLSADITDCASHSKHMMTVAAEELESECQTSVCQSEAVIGMQNFNGAPQLRSSYRLMEVPGAKYFNEALLCVRLDHESDFSSLSSELNERINVDPILVPARAAIGPSHPTTLHFLLYMLRRQLVAGIANAALVALRIYALQHEKQRAPSWSPNTSDLTEQSASKAPSRWSIRLFERYAKPCDGASALALELLRWHTLCAGTAIKEGIALPSSIGVTANISPSVREVLWCVSMYVKLRLRGLRLWGCVGNQDKKQLWIRDLRNVLERWDRQRQRDLESSSPSTGDGIERCFAKIPDALWQELLEGANVSMTVEQ